MDGGYAQAPTQKTRTHFPRRCPTQWLASLQATICVCEQFFSRDNVCLRVAKLLATPSEMKCTECEKSQEPNPAESEYGIKHGRAIKDSRILNALPT